MQKYANDYGIPIIYVNMIGAEGSIVFDGGSSLVHPDGTWQYGELLEEHIILVNAKRSGKLQSPELRESLQLRKALPGLSYKGKFRKQNLEAAVIGLSGALIVQQWQLFVENIGADKVVGISLPTRYTSQENIMLAQE